MAGLTLHAPSLFKASMISQCTWVGWGGPLPQVLLIAWYAMQEWVLSEKEHAPYAIARCYRNPPHICACLPWLQKPDAMHGQGCLCTPSTSQGHFILCISRPQGCLPGQLAVARIITKLSSANPSCIQWAAASWPFGVCIRVCDDLHVCHKV